MAMELNSDKTVKVHLGIVALFQVVVAVITVAVAFTIVRADVSNLSHWKDTHTVEQRTFERDYRRSNEALIRAISKLEVTVNYLADEVSDLRHQRAGNGNGNGNRKGK